MLQARDAPPEGIPEQLGFLAFTDGSCFDEESEEESDPAIVVHDPFEIAESNEICLAGFAPEERITVTVDGPSDFSRRFVIEEPGEFAPSIEWISLPGEPLGTYGAHAQQGERMADVEFDVKLSSTARVLELDPYEAPAGATFRFALAGYDARSTVELFLYRAEREEQLRWVYVTEAPPARVDERGEAYYELMTFPDDPPGDYCLTRRPAGCQRGGDFRVTGE